MKMKIHISSLLFFACLVLQFACTKPENGDPDPPPPPPKIKKQLLNFYTYSENSGGYGPVKYDSTGRIDFYDGNNGYSGYKLVYNSDTLQYIVGPVSTFNGEYQRYSWIFIYGADKRCKKVLNKYRQSYIASEMGEDNQYFGDATDGNAVLRDSLVYFADGKLNEIWHSSGNSVYLVVKFTYSIPGQAEPSRISDYSGVGTDFSQYTLLQHTDYTYTSTDQPAYLKFWFVPFIERFFPVSPTSPPTFSKNYLVLFRKAIQKYTVYQYTQPQSSYNSQLFEYGYNSDSTVYDGKCNPDDILFNRMQLRFAYKEF